MAIYHFTAKIVSRSRGQSVVAKAAYNAREALTDERTGENPDYRRKGGIVFSGIFAPKDAPAWAQDRQTLWNEVEKSEKRKNSQLAREVEIALPHELTDQQREYLVKDFVRENFVRHGMVADVAIHAPDKEGDERNHHAHILLGMRELAPDGFGEKLREFNSKKQLEDWREKWEHLANRHLERHGHDARIDRRSLEAQGIEREPPVHLGPDASHMERKGKSSELGDKNRAIEEQSRRRVQLETEQKEIMAALEQAQKTERDRQQQEKDEKEKKRAGHLGATLYDRADMVSMQQDAMRHIRDAHRIQERNQEPSERKKAQKEVEEFRRSRLEERQALTPVALAREERKDRTEQTDYKQRKAERDAMRETRPARVGGRMRDEDGRERERER